MLKTCGVAGVPKVPVAVVEAVQHAEVETGLEVVVEVVVVVSAVAAGGNAISDTNIPSFKSHFSRVFLSGFKM